MDPSRILIVYYSRTGATRAVAAALRAELTCEIESLVEPHPTRGRGFLRSFTDALLRRPAEIAPLHVDLSAYDLVVIGTPVWNASAATPVRAFLERHAAELPLVAFFSTHAGVGSARALRELGEACAKAPLLTLDVRREEVRDRAIAAKVRSFASALQVLARDPWTEPASPLHSGIAMRAALAAPADEAQVA